MSENSGAAPRRRRRPGQSRILLASPDPVVRETVRRSIEEGTDAWVLCAEHSTAASALENLELLDPDVVVLDVASRGGVADTRTFARFVGGGTQRARVLVLGAADSEALVANALKAGVKGILSASDVEDLLGPALEAVSRGKPFFSSSATEILLERFLAKRGRGGTPRRASGRSLTRREREVVRLLAEGQSTRDVAARLSISVKTAENHRANAMNKLGVHRVSELVRQAIQEGIIS